jgi:hypothetical protein
MLGSMGEPRRTGKRVAALAIALALSGGISTRAWADAGADIDAGEAAYAGLDYEKANTLAQRAVASHGLTHEQVVRAYRLLGRTYAVVGKSQQAIDAFEKLLTYAPDEKVDQSQTPRIQEAFSEAQGFWAGFSAKPGMDATTVALRAAKPGTLRVHLRDPTHQVKKVVVGYRWGGTSAFVTADVAPVETMNVELPAGPPEVARLDYYVVALDGLDDQAFTVGDPNTPRTVLAEVAPASAGGGGGGIAEHAGGHSIFASPVFWAVTGVVIAGGVTGAYLATRKATDVTLPPNNANITPSLFCGGTGACH